MLPKIRPEFRRPLESGMTILEMLIASVILAVLVLVAVRSAVTSQEVAVTEQITTDMEFRARELLGRFSSELREARPPQPFQNQSSILFQRNTGVVGGQIQWGGDIIYNRATEVGEAVGNGIDDNGNGLIDEGVVVRTEGGVGTVICRGVAPNGLLFTSDATGITMDLVLISRDGDTVHQRDYQTKVVPRN